MGGGARHPSKLGTFVISATTYLEILMILRFLIFTRSFTTVALEGYCGIFFGFSHIVVMLSGAYLEPSRTST